MKIKIICVGKLKEAYLRDACAEYLKRIGAYADISVREVADESIRENASEAEIRKALDREGERILAALSPGDHVIACDLGGKKYSSEGFSEHIWELMNRGKSSIAFVIGGSCGISGSVRSMASDRISFSDMTFPHQLARVILLEQIYRSFKIMRGEPYHK